MDPQTRPPQDGGNPAEMIPENHLAAGDWGLLEFPLQEQHHQIIAAFMEELQHNASPGGLGKSIRFW